MIMMAEVDDVFVRISGQIAEFQSPKRAHATISAAATAAAAGLGECEKIPGIDGRPGSPTGTSKRQATRAPHRGRRVKAFSFADDRAPAD